MRRKNRSATEVITGFLDRGTTVTGELRFSGTLRIDGDFHGSISTDDALTIGEYAEVHADIRAGHVEIHGRVCGNIEASSRVEIRCTGRVSADIRTPVLVIDDGGSLDGRSQMNDEHRSGDEASPQRVAFEGVDEVN